MNAAQLLVACSALVTVVAAIALLILIFGGLAV